MGYLHSLFIVLSGAAFSILLFSTFSFLGGAGQLIKTCMVVIGPVLWSSLLLNRHPNLQIRALTISRIIVIVLLSLYYYFHWKAGIFSQESQTNRWALDFLLIVFSPILGYIFLSLSVRVLARKLSVLRNVDRLRD